MVFCLGLMLSLPLDRLHINAIRFSLDVSKIYLDNYIQNITILLVANKIIKRRKYHFLIGLYVIILLPINLIRR